MTGFDMQRTTALTQNGERVPPQTLTFYRDVLETLNRAQLPYLIGGTYALNHYTGVSRDTKDFDIFIARADYERISTTLESAGYRCELTYPHWLAKVYFGTDVIDLVFSSGNGVAEVDDAWFTHANAADIFGIPVKMCPAEETLWSKAFIMERERFDGADVAHLILTQGEHMDWARLLQRFSPHWRLLLSHLVLFGFIYPGHRHAVPTQVMSDLSERLQAELNSPASADEVCGGTLLSREQYLSDINQRGYQDARLVPHGKMTAEDAAHWTDAIKDKYN